MPCYPSPPYGRLFILRIEHPLTVKELHELGISLRADLAKIQRPGAILATDLTHTKVWPPDVAEAFVRLMRSGNSILAASALLTTGVGTFCMQVERVVKEAGLPNRQAFHKRTEFDAWLIPKLTPEELEAFHKHFKPAM